MQYKNGEKRISFTIERPSAIKKYSKFGGRSKSFGQRNSGGGGSRFGGSRGGFGR
jgi:hypothetical protein